MSELKHISRIERNIRELGKKLIDAPQEPIHSHKQDLTAHKKTGLRPTPAVDKTGNHENFHPDKVEPVLSSS